jgi:hypothetical protein
MLRESSGTSNNSDEAIKLIGLAIIAMVVLVCMLVYWLNPPEKPRQPLCEYCRVGQADAKPFPCRQCGKVHMSCGKESGLRAFDARKDKEGFAIGRSIKVCPEGTDAR